MNTDRRAAKTVLLVDDEPDVVMMVRGRLASWGYEVVIAVNGQEALDAVRRRPPDLILLDLKMPILGGRDTCHQLKADPRFAKIPVVLMTSSSAGVVQEELRDIGADDYVLKPFEPAELQAKIQRRIG